ncbi:MAG: SapC family protein [Rhodospirillales bacterium]|nr:SapC family protein [Rhodospirillales bacterium]
MPSRPTLPLFFRSMEPIAPERHGGLRLDRQSGYAFAAPSPTLPLGLGEFESASRHYPILFSAGAAPTPVVLMGLAETGNLFILPDGAWRPDAYIPAYLRAYPFVHVEDRGRNTSFVGIDATASCLHTGKGAALFEDGRPSAALIEAINFCNAVRDNLAAAAAFGRAMEAAGLLREEEATIRYTGGGSGHVRGFKVLQAERLDAVDDETFLDWRRRGWIGPIYAHLNSAGRWARLMELAARQPQAAAVPASQSAMPPHQEAQTQP